MMDTPTREISIHIGTATLQGILRVPRSAAAVVIFAHGSGSGRRSPRNNLVAERLSGAGLASCLFDLLTEPEEARDAMTAALRFDIPLLTERLIAATRWVRHHPNLQNLRLGYFGASTGAAAALGAAAVLHDVAAVVSRGGRPDLAGASLAKVRAPTLLIVGGEDPEVLALNREALARMRCEAKLEIVPNATHLFEEPGTLEQAAGLALDWFTRHLAAPGASPNQS